MKRLKFITALVAASLLLASSSFASGATKLSLWLDDGSSLYTKYARALVPYSSDEGALGSTTKMWSDLFLASGGVINWNNGNATLTHSADLLTSNVPVLFPSGTAVAPSITFSNDSNTGFYSFGADQIGITLGGVVKALISPTVIGHVNGVFAHVAGGTVVLRGAMADGASAIGAAIDTFGITYTAAGSKLLSIRNNATEKAYIDKDGGYTVGTSVISGTSIYGATSYHGAGGLQNATATESTLIKGRINDGGANPAAIIDNATALTTAGNKLLSVRNATVEKAYVDYLGAFYSGGGVFGLDSTDYIQFINNTQAVTYINGTPYFAVKPAGVEFNNAISLNINVPMTFKSYENDAADSIGFSYDTNTALTTAGAKLTKISNATVEKYNLTKDGYINATPSGSTVIPTYSFVGDENTGIGSGTADQLDFIAGGIRQAVIINGRFQTNKIWSLSGSLQLQGPVTDGATAKAVKIAPTTLYATEGAEVASFYKDNLTTQVAAVDLNGTYSQVKGTVQTTDATQTTAVSMTLAEGIVYHVQGIVVGKQGNTNRASYRLDVTVYRPTGGSATIQGSITSIHAQESDTDWDATFDVSGNDLRMRITGDVGQTVTWKSTLTFTQY